MIWEFALNCRLKYEIYFKSQYGNKWCKQNFSNEAEAETSAKAQKGAHTAKAGEEMYETRPKRQDEVLQRSRVQELSR